MLRTAPDGPAVMLVSGGTVSAGGEVRVEASTTTPWVG